jgi:hypothetical protein
VYEGNPNLKEFEILASPNQIGWFDRGNDSDEISDISLKQINTIFFDYQGYLAIEMDYYKEEPTLYDNKVTIRTLDHQEEDDDDWDETLMDGLEEEPS